MVPVMSYSFNFFCVSVFFLQNCCFVYTYSTRVGEGKKCWLLLAIKMKARMIPYEECGGGRRPPRYVTPDLSYCWEGARGEKCENKMGWRTKGKKLLLYLPGPRVCLHCTFLVCSKSFSFKVMILFLCIYLFFFLLCVCWPWLFPFLYPWRLLRRWCRVEDAGSRWQTRQRCSYLS